MRSCRSARPNLTLSSLTALPTQSCTPVLGSSIGPQRWEGVYDEAMAQWPLEERYLIDSSLTIADLI